MFAELNALRLYEVTRLRGSSWETYRNARVRFPIEGIQGGGEGTVSYETVQSTLAVRGASDDGYYQILGQAGVTGQTYFFIKENSELGGPKIFGPFYDDLTTILSQI